MKIFYPFASTAFAAFLIFSVVACGPSNKELIVGTWTGTDFSFEQTEGPDLADLVKGGEQLHINGKLILEETGTYIISTADDVINGKGTWEIKGDEFTMIDEQDNEVVYEIIDLSKAEMTTLHEVKMETPLGNLAGKITLTYKK